MEKKNPGRPKKNKTIPATEFLGNVAKPTISNAVNEIVLSEASALNQYLKTFKTLRVNDLTIYFTADGMVIESLINNRTTGGVINGDKRLYINLKKSYSYYCSKPCAVKITSIVNLDSLMDEIDENTKFLTIYTTDVSNVLSYKICDEINDIDTTSSLDVDSISYDFPKIVVPGELDIRLSIEGYKPSDLKKTFNKKTRKKCDKCTLKAINDEIKIDFVPSTGKITNIVMNSRKTRPIKSHQRDMLYQINIPKSDINQFIMHIKENITIMFSDKYILMQNESASGLQIRYQIPIDSVEKAQ
jgi:hypothetical protein